MAAGLSLPESYHDLQAISVPAFARLADYCGLWIIEQNAAIALRHFADTLNLAVHVKEDPESLRCAMEKLPATGGKSIAVVRLSGILMKSQSSMGGTSTIQARRDIRQAANDPEVSAILLAIDSPGGTVAGTDDLAQEVKAAKRQVPVWAHVDDLGASAAYWVASQASRITANSPTALVGSIGTIQVIHDISTAAERDGVRTLVFATGALKGLGTPGSKVTDEQAAHVQQLVDSVQTNFDAAVKRGRGLTDRQLADVRHGGVMTAHDAMDKKLIDAVQPLAKTLAELTQSISAGPKAQIDSGRTGALPLLARHRLPML